MKTLIVTEPTNRVSSRFVVNKAGRNIAKPLLKGATHFQSQLEVVGAKRSNECHKYIRRIIASRAGKTNRKDRPEDNRLALR
ncbi:hypothetical protein [Planctomycetes bacterium K23_9]|uniref:hypothetical protein n=1 Tax=Stieleria marina TaxID=1930275 RepID=UPI0011A1EFCB